MTVTEIRRRAVCVADPAAAHRSLLATVTVLSCVVSRERGGGGLGNICGP